MAMTESGSGAAEPATTSTELVVRPQAPTPVPVTPRKTTVASPVRAATGVMRVAVSAAVEASAWGLSTALGVTGIVLRGSMAGQPPREVLSEAGAQVRDSVLQALGVPERQVIEQVATEQPAPAAELRARGAELLRRSADFHEDDTHHPAYSRILGELTPDEARIIRFLYLDGPQPILEVRTGRASAGEFNLLGEDAGLRYPNRVDQYLINLDRLGLVDIAREPLGNPNRYQLLEALPEVRQRLKRAGFGTKVLYRTIELTSFGAGFVRICLPVPSLDQAL